MTIQHQKLLAAWAENFRLSNHPAIVELQAALERSAEISWTAVELNQFLPVKAPFRFRRMRLLQAIVLLRGVLIFLPVAVTWFGISQATSAFERFTIESTTTTVNFLEFWQNGYGYLASEWRLSNVALVDCFIVLGVIVLTVLISLGNFNLAAEEERQTARFQATRQRLIFQMSATDAGVDLERAERQVATAAQLLAGVSEEVSNLSRVTESITQAFSRLDNAAASMNSQATALEQSIKSVIAAADVTVDNQSKLDAQTKAATESAHAALTELSAETKLIVNALQDFRLKIDSLFKG